MRKVDYQENKEVYAVYVEGRSAPRRRYKDLGLAESEAIRLTADTRRRTFVVKLISMFKAKSDAEIANLKWEEENIKKKNERKLLNKRK